MSAPRLVSVCVGLPVIVRIDGNDVSTAIFKEPVEGRVRVLAHNIDGDRQADLRVHGGPDKAVYAYPAAHYPLWSRELDCVLEYGAFGENLTIEGLDEHGVHPGDRLRIGTVSLRVTIPRQPCFKLAHKFGRSDIVRKFWASGRSGFYLAVDVEGELGAGDEVLLERVDPDAPSIAELIAERAALRADRTR